MAKQKKLTCNIYRAGDNVFTQVKKKWYRKTANSTLADFANTWKDCTADAIRYTNKTKTAVITPNGIAKFLVTQSIESSEFET